MYSYALVRAVPGQGKRSPSHLEYKADGFMVDVLHTLPGMYFEVTFNISCKAIYSEYTSNYVLVVLLPALYAQLNTPEYLV